MRPGNDATQQVTRPRSFNIPQWKNVSHGEVVMQQQRASNLQWVPPHLTRSNQQAVLPPASGPSGSSTPRAFIEMPDESDFSQSNHGVASRRTYSVPWDPALQKRDRSHINEGDRPRSFQHNYDCPISFSSHCWNPYCHSQKLSFFQNLFLRTTAAII